MVKLKVIHFVLMAAIVATCTQQNMLRTGRNARRDTSYMSMTGIGY